MYIPLSSPQLFATLSRITSPQKLRERSSTPLSGQQKPFLKFFFFRWTIFLYLSCAPLGLDSEGLCP
jgi:hypothetical protein